MLILLAMAGTLTNAQVESRRNTPRLTTDDVMRRRTSGTVILESRTRSEPSNRTPVTESAKPEPARVEPERARGAISWRRDIESALAEARSEGKVVVVDVYTDWCGWCKKMDQNIYSSPLVVSLSKREVFLKLDAEDGGEGQRFAARMRVRGYPTTIILDEDGEPLAAKSGYIDTPQKFLTFVETARQR
jgi:thiol:disulfide interchange protein